MNVILADSPNYVSASAGPWRMCIYDEGGLLLRQRSIGAPDSEVREGQIPSYQAALEAGLAAGGGMEVRVADASDAVVFHAKGRAILHGRDFWALTERNGRTTVAA